MKETYLCERCGTPFVRDRVSSRGCSKRCARWLYEHQDLYPPQPPAPFPRVRLTPDEWAAQEEARRKSHMVSTAEKAAHIKELRRLAMQRYRARKAAGLVSPPKPVDVTYKEWLRAQVAFSPVQRACENCGKIFVFHPSSGMLPGCSLKCRQVLLRDRP